MDYCEKLRLATSLEEDLYDKMCIGCQSELYCHEECTNCDDYLERLEESFVDHGIADFL